MYPLTLKFVKEKDSGSAIRYAIKKKRLEQYFRVFSIIKDAEIQNLDLLSTMNLVNYPFSVIFIIIYELLYVILNILLTGSVIVMLTMIPVYYDSSKQ